MEFEKIIKVMLTNTLAKKFIFFSLFVALAPLTLAVSLYSLAVIKQPLIPNSLAVNMPALSYAALPASSGQVEGSFTTADSRPVLIKNYLAKYQSPLLPYANLIFQLSERYQIDFRLPLAIAQCESNVCKKIPPDSYNCWGFENGATKFSSWEHALERVFKTLKEGYIDKGLVTPEQIMPKYAPPAVGNGGSWARCVKQYLKELE
jgi:hypothetical protein